MLTRLDAKMKRLIDFHLRNWKNDPDRKSLLLRGVRQVGKTLLFFDEMQEAPKANG